jgi:hypothetical protein
LPLASYYNDGQNSVADKLLALRKLRRSLESGASGRCPYVFALVERELLGGG